MERPLLLKESVLAPLLSVLGWKQDSCGWINFSNMVITMTIISRSITCNLLHAHRVALFIIREVSSWAVCANLRCSLNVNVDG
mmetsp:Transcript_22789/g.63584  ORF Transcript_22789/g.63584 Transcript_22789/m.63584 type:complete len:83 (-) Transcript_22789:499-747(-)